MIKYAKFVINFSSQFKRPLYNLFNFHFSESSLLLDPKNDLMKSFENEIKFEESNLIEDKDNELLLAKLGFQKIDDENSINVILKKQIGPLQIEILFRAKEPMLEPSNLPEIPENAGTIENVENRTVDNKDEKQPKTEDMDPDDFQLLIKKENGEGIVLDCNCLDDQLTITSISYSNDIQKTLFPSSISKINMSYLGPDFSRCTDELKESFKEYIESLGITSRVANYIKKASREKEKRIYLKWLKDMKSFFDI